ncbi:MAG TPA: class II glutamine amidotransferase [Polyangiaceae bacterium]|nr:class II glutamine amidotransferase [Polyangiaceae bacterium]
MARMFGFMGNRSDLGARVLEQSAPVLRVERQDDRPLGWGIGFYQSGEALLRRRPIDERAVIDLAEAAEDIRTDALIGHVRRATVGSLRTENTHPFRYRLWLFAQTGSIGGFDRLRERLLGSLPEFLRRNVRGETDSELFFYLFLSFLHDAGHLDRQHVDAAHVSAALRASIALVDRLSAEEGFPENSGDILVTNGELLTAVHRNHHTAYRVIHGRHDVEELLGEEGLRRTRIPSIESTRFSLIAAELDGVPQGWQAAPAASILTLTRSDDPVVEPL